MYNIQRKEVVILNRAIKYKLKPNKEQIIFFEKNFGCSRFVWNQMLGIFKENFDNHKNLVIPTPASLKKDHPFLKEVDSLALSNVQLQFNQAKSQFFKSLKGERKGEKLGFPKFKSKRQPKKTYTTNNHNDTIAIQGSKIRLPKVGQVKAVIHRMPKEDWKLKSATISCDVDGHYYISILFEFEQKIELKNEVNSAIGIDYASNGFGITNFGDQLKYSKHFYENQEKLALEQRKLSRKIKHSKSWYRQLRRVNKIHKKMSNQRKDFAHKLSYLLAEEFDLVAVEGINLKNIAQLLNLSKATNDNGFGMFRGFLRYKLIERGKYYYEVEQFTPTSIVCSCCGVYHKDIVNSLAVREWTCPDCGTHHDRDVNAAKNILQHGLNALNGLEIRIELGQGRPDGYADFVREVREHLQTTDSLRAVEQTPLNKEKSSVRMSYSSKGKTGSRRN